MNRIFLCVFVALSLLGNGTCAQYPEWQHTGSIFLNTTAVGALFPATTVVEEFPVLIRLDKQFFDFSAAKVNGDDLRFSGSGQPLAYQIEHWDAQAGVASIWVRVPKIVGNARQELRIHWGKTNATSESNGSAVFNESNGYLSVLHMGTDLADSVGTVQTMDVGTVATGGIIGTARHFNGSTGIFGGQEITQYPVGSNPHSTETWLRAERSNGRAVA